MIKNSGVEVIKNIFKERIDIFIDEFEKTKNYITADNLHDLRVSIRRLSAAFSILKVFPDVKIKKSVIKQVHSLMKPLGILRDTLVGMDILDDTFKNKNEFINVFMEKTGKRIQKIENNIKNNMDKFSLKDLKELENNRIFDPLMNLINMDMEYELHVIICELFKKFASYRQQAEKKDMKVFHRMRISLKKLRYTTEILKDIIPWVTEKKLNDMHILQQTMGKIHDIDLLLIKINKSKFKNYNKPQEELKKERFLAANELNKKRLLLFREFNEQVKKLFSYENDFIKLPDVDSEQKLQTAFNLMLENIHKKQEKTFIENALFYIKNIHILHPLRTALILAEEMKISDPEIITSALLHDTIEVKGSSVTKDKIEKRFGKRVSDIVWNLTKEETENGYVRYIDKIKNGGEAVKIIKLADRLDSTRHITSKSLKKQKAYWKSNFNDIFPICKNINSSYWDFFYREFKLLWEKTSSNIKKEIKFPKKK